MRGSVIVASCLVGLLVGCSTTSTISRVNGPDIEGDIVGGSPDSIFVARGGGGEDEIARDDISEIDYPGNVHTGVGVGVGVYGLLNIAAGLPKCERTNDNQAAFCTGVFLPAALGAGMIIWGLVVHHGQTAAVEDTSRESGLKRQRPEPAAPPRLKRESGNVTAPPASAAPSASAPPAASEAPPPPAVPSAHPAAPSASAPAPVPPASAAAPPTKAFPGPP